MFKITFKDLISDSRYKQPIRCDLFARVQIQQLISRHFCHIFHVSGESQVLQGRVFWIVELLPKSELFSRWALTQVGSAWFTLIPVVLQSGF